MSATHEIDAAAARAHDDGLERLVTAVPGPRSLALGARLARGETRGVTYLADDFPIFWESGAGALVTDADSNRYIDATAAFGVATTGHANPAVARAIADQAARLSHGMGDVHPTAAKTALLERLAALAPVDDARTFLCSSGAESVEFARKTARLATGRVHALAFEGGYHGLSYGALELGGIAKFREPWADQLAATTSLAPFPDAGHAGSAERSLAAVAARLAADPTIGAVVVEPIQGRAGVIVPPDGWLAALAALCAAHGALLVADEIYTGFGRTGDRFACDRDGVRPDVLCVGKALAGGFPISAAIVRGAVADAWPRSAGEALHTSTYLGNPMGCAAALANLAEIDRLDIPRIAREREDTMAQGLGRVARASGRVTRIRGRGMLWALEFDDAAVANAAVVRALGRGLVLLQSGARGECVGFSPPPVISDAQLARAFELFALAVAP